MGRIHSTPLIGRVLEYGGRHGWRATLKRAGVSFQRLLAGHRLVLYQLDLANYEPVLPADEMPRTFERKHTTEEIGTDDLQRLLNAWNPTVARRQLAERFGKGASLWLCKQENVLAGFGWTICGGTVEPHFFPLQTRDAHLFDFFVFPEFRGRRVNLCLVNHILSALASEGMARAYIEAAEWNTSQLKSLARTPFQPFGRARKFRFFGRRIVVWEQPNVPSPNTTHIN